MIFWGLICRCCVCDDRYYYCWMMIYCRYHLMMTICVMMTHYSGHAVSGLCFLTSPEIIPVGCCYFNKIFESFLIIQDYLFPEFDGCFL